MSPKYTLDGRLDGPQYRSGQRGEEKKKTLPLPRLKLRPLGRPAPSQSLYRLHHELWQAVRSEVGLGLSSYVEMRRVRMRTRCWSFNCYARPHARRHILSNSFYSRCKQTKATAVSKPVFLVLSHPTLMISYIYIYVYSYVLQRERHSSSLFHISDVTFATLLIRQLFLWRDM
jgi:hypothetical protein